MRRLSPASFSHCCRSLTSVLAFCLVAGQFSSASAQATTRVETGTLSATDSRLPNGEFFDRYEFEGREGQHFEFNLTSDDFDTFVQVHPLDESGDVDSSREWHNDDFESSGSHSRIEFALPETGRYAVYVTSYGAKETGGYELKITMSGGRVESDKLGANDERLDTGEYFDVYRFSASQGETWVFDLQSDDFDTYVYVRCPEDKEFKLDNDDYLHDSDRSQIVMTAPHDGAYLVYVTSYKAGETGAYRLTFSNTPAAALAGDGMRRESGRLEAGDGTLKSGEYYDSYELEGVPGQHVRIELTSSDFDTYVMLVDPLGERVANDDFEEETRRSVIETDLTELGGYTIAVTSYEAGETGAYELAISTTEVAPDAPAPVVADSETAPDRPNSGAGQRLDESETLTAQLADDDEQTEEGRYSHVYDFDATIGDRLMVDMTSRAFDTVLTLTFPDGRTDRFDDNSPSDTNSRIDLMLEQTGRYRLVATSYELSTGEYALDFALGDSDSAPPAPISPVVPGRRIYGIFVGIANYQYAEANLLYTDEDARSLHRLFIEQYNMRPDDSALLLNDEATVENIMDAIRELGAQAGPDDLLVFFYSGHGSVGDGNRSAQDPNGIHEVLGVYDGVILDDDFASAINESGAGLCLIALDACCSGGFSKNVCSAEGRLGLFSSAEDVQSAVAGKFRAGGYLSKFLVEAIGEERFTADRDHNQELTAWELCQYISDRYADEVQSTKQAPAGNGKGDTVSVSGNLSYQTFQADRSCVRHDQVFFQWE
ncbi:MAG: caspase family protein [Planctomycetaceae bacterium]|nr:caspase family protein [Planctomycetaceae bacterium]